MASSSYECQETGTYVGQTRCKFTNCDFYGQGFEFLKFFVLSYFVEFYKTVDPKNRGNLKVTQILA